MNIDTLRIGLRTANPVVVKVGSNVLTDERGSLRDERIAGLIAQINELRQQGRKVALVSSGAIGAGVGVLKLPQRPTDLPHLQACAAVGQTQLMQRYQSVAATFGIATGQILLTTSDVNDRTRYLNIRNTLLTLYLNMAACRSSTRTTPLALRKITFGDNDRLAAIVANLLGAPLLVLLSNVDGLFDGDPSNDANARIIPFVESITPEVSGLARSTKSLFGTGGMTSKLQAARIATRAGGTVALLNGNDPDSLRKLFHDEPIGTLFAPEATTLPARKRWLGFSAKVKGILTLDAGAVNAILQQGRSLLPVGVVAVEGSFEKGDLVALIDAEGNEVGRGLTNYGHVQAERIRQCRTERIAEQLRRCTVCRDDPSG